MVSVTGQADDADVLSAWIERFAASSEASHVRSVADWLRNRATSDDWHRATSDLSWDYGAEPFLWIARQQRCEKSTALTIFYLARPGQMLEYVNDSDKLPAWLTSSFHLVSEVRSRFVERFYAAATIAFDGVNASNNEAYLPADPPADLLRAMIPDVMRQSIPGRTLSNRYDVEPGPWL